MDINHTDQSANGGTPLCQLWERVAAKELCDINHYLCHGLFINAADMADRLRQAADAIEDSILERISRIQVVTVNDEPQPNEPIGWIDGEPIYGEEGGTFVASRQIADQDPVVLWEPGVGPIRDSELQQIVEEVRRELGQ